MFMSQTSLIEELCSKCNLTAGKDSMVPFDHGFVGENQTPFDNHTVYRSVLGMVGWICMCTRPDVAFYWMFLAGFCNDPRVCHWEHLKKLVAYLRATRALGVLLGCDADQRELEVFCDASHGDPLLDRRSTSGWVFFLGGAPIAWVARKQKCMSKSSAEAEYIAMSEMANEAKYYLNILSALCPHINKVFARVDSEPARRIANGDATIRKVKHLEIAYHHVREMSGLGQIQFDWLTEEHMVADLFTKVMTDKNRFLRLRGYLLHE
jgi:hypothetical protein